MVPKIQNSNAALLERRIECIKYTLFCFSAIMWILGSGTFGLSLWLRIEPGFQEWVEFLQINEFYIGVNILIFAAVLVIAISFVGCASSLMESQPALFVNIGLQGLSFVFALAGSAVLLDYSTYDSQIQPLIRKSMTNLIINSQHTRVSVVLRMVQENIGCCGADGPMDYLTLLKPLPTECRDTVTGNAFFHGCVEELTWFLEARSGWLAGLALGLCMIHV
ncbi:PREDICTED: CD81 antigen [Ceratosolen solmsi marchali]|uniref:Tetraspanin n=1 Tax=Ceratosolen solmsi marchali TaxID=326594 RepID=A0AAJ6YPK2_9HYME|nr:PREDICTED: CD81 antigen [Ceratosolen solmsi marchali]